MFLFAEVEFQNSGEDLRAPKASPGGRRRRKDGNNIIAPLGAIFCTRSRVRQENALELTFWFLNTIIGIVKGREGERDIEKVL